MDQSVQKVVLIPRWGGQSFILDKFLLLTEESLQAHAGELAPGHLPHRDQREQTGPGAGLSVRTACSQHVGQNERKDWTCGVDPHYVLSETKRA